MLSGRIRHNVRVIAGCRKISSRLDALDHEETLEGCLTSLPSEAKVVICGGGVMGAAVAYHLARRGWGGKTILVEKESWSRQSLAFLGSGRCIQAIPSSSTSSAILNSAAARIGVTRTPNGMEAMRLATARTHKRQNDCVQENEESVRVPATAMENSDELYDSMMREFANRPGLAFGPIRTVRVNVENDRVDTETFNVSVMETTRRRLRELEIESRAERSTSRPQIYSPQPRSVREAVNTALATPKPRHRGRQYTVQEAIAELQRSMEDTPQAVNAPVVNAPAANAPVVNAPAANAPVAYAPAANASAMNAPAANAREVNTHSGNAHVGTARASNAGASRGPFGIDAQAIHDNAYKVEPSREEMYNSFMDTIRAVSGDDEEEVATWSRSIPPDQPLYYRANGAANLLYPSYFYLLNSSWGIPCELISPRRCLELSPILNVDDIVGGLWIPGDGVGDPHLFGMSLMREAISQGVGVMEDCAVTAVLSKDERVCGVETTRGAIDCQYFVNCAGFWARQVGQLARPQVKVPLLPCEHYYLHTKTINGLDPMTPVIRDPDGYIYLRERDGCILAGGFEPVAKPVYEEEITNSAQRCVAEDWDHFHVLLQQLLKRVPSLSQAVLHRLCNGLEAFSPDCKWIVGEAPEMMNYHVAAGMKTVGISAAGGVAEATADEIIDGYSKYDMYELGINRFLGLHNNKRFLRDRVKEVPGVHYGLPYPFPEFETGRNLRLSPIYPTLRDNGAVFGQVMGYERPTWFETVENQDADTKPKPFKIAYTKTFGKPHWFETVQREYWACRESVGLADYSSFTKIDLQSQGREVVDFLQYLCSNDVDVPVGSIIHTGMQNERGGYENDCSLARISENHYMMIAPTIQQTRCKTWMKRHLPQNGSVTLSDVTSMYTAICVMGPFTRNLLSELTDTDLSPSNFPFFTFKEIDVGLANGIRAMNLTHTGELGYVLYIPNEFALHVYNRLMTEGQKFGISHVGYYASRALRVEKFFAFWGQDLDTMTTPLECGRTWRVKFHKDIPFIGREALLRQREEGIRRQYVQLLLTDHDHELDLWSWGGEPIFRDGNYCGQTTTTSYGYTFKKQVCLGFVENLNADGVPQKITNEYVLSGHYEIDIAGIRYAAKLNLHSPNLPTKYPDKERDVYKATRKPHESQYLGRHYQP